MNSRLNRIENWGEFAIRAKWRVNGIAQLCGVSPRALQSHFRRALEMTPKQWVTEKRMSLAKEYLVEGFLVKETAKKLAYESEHQFSREFKNYWGFWPTETEFLMSKLRLSA